MKTGIKIPYDIFCEEKSETTKKLLECFNGCDGFFGYLEKNFDTVEIGVVFFGTDGSILKDGAFLCSKFGLNVTIHGSLNDIKNAEEFFTPYLPLFESDLQDYYNITVHPFENPDDTEKLLEDICRCAKNNDYPVRITLENQRFTNERLINTLCKNVAEIVNNINSKYLYCCFDFGHQLYNQIKYGEKFDAVESDFLSVVKHTHIHSLYNDKTHFPLSCGETLLEYNIKKLLCHNYDGVFLLELAPARYLDEFDIKTSIEDSIRILKTALLQFNNTNKI